jgi:hypothetical protein
MKNKKEFCLSTNKVISGEPVQGAQLIEEELRSYFLFEAMKKQNTIEKWLEYMVVFDQNLCL